MAKDLIAERIRIGVNPRDPSLPIVNVVERTASESAVTGEKYFEVYTANALGGGFAMMKARGTVAAPANVQQDDSMGVFYFKGYSGSFQNTASLEALVDAAVVLNQRPASRLELKTNEANAAPRLVAHVSKEGYLGVGIAFNPAIAATRAAYLVHAVASGTGSNVTSALESYDAAGYSSIRANRARGTFAAPTIVQSGDRMGEFTFGAYTNQWHESAKIASFVLGTPAAGVIPDSDLEFVTAVSGGRNLRVRIMPNGRTIFGQAVNESEAVIAANSIARIFVAGADSHEAIAVQRSSADAGACAIYGGKSRGTVAAPASVQANDELLYVQGRAYTNAWHDNVGAIVLYVDGAVTAGQRPGNRIAFRTGPSGAGGPSDRMVIYSGGTVLVGAGAVDTSRTFHIHTAGGTIAMARIQVTGGGGTNHVLRLDGGDNATTGSKFLIFHRPDGTEIGSVSQNAAGTVAYNTSSDGRLKADIQDSDMGLSEVLQIRPRRFRFRTDPSNQILHGFVAQELITVFPEAVTVGGVTKDCDCDLGRRGEHDPDCCNSNSWGVDYGKLTPLLVRAVQQIAERLSILETR